MDALTIGEVARRAGIATSAIRYYESIGLLPAPPRASGQRRYAPDILERLTVINNARNLGLSIEEIRTLLLEMPPDASPNQRWAQVAQRKLPELDSLLQQVEALKHQLEVGAQCECDDINECLIDGCEDESQPSTTST